MHFGGKITKPVTTCSKLAKERERKRREGTCFCRRAVDFDSILILASAVDRMRVYSLFSQCLHLLRGRQAGDRKYHRFSASPMIHFRTGH